MKHQTDRSELIRDEVEFFVTKLPSMLNNERFVKRIDRAVNPPKSLVIANAHWY